MLPFHSELIDQILRERKRVSVTNYEHKITQHLSGFIERGWDPPIEDKIGVARRAKCSPPSLFSERAPSNDDSIIPWNLTPIQFTKYNVIQP